MKQFVFFLFLLGPLFQVYGQYLLSFSSDSVEVSIHPNDFELGETVVVQLVDDLNQDGMKDFILNFQLCNSMGDCMYAIFMQQKNGKFTCVYQPEYWSYFKVKSSTKTSAKSKNWKELVVYERTGKLNSTNEEDVKIYLLKYNGQLYLPSKY